MSGKILHDPVQINATKYYNLHMDKDYLLKLDTHLAAGTVIFVFFFYKFVNHTMIITTLHMVRFFV